MVDNFIAEANLTFMGLSELPHLIKHPKYNNYIYKKCYVNQNQHLLLTLHYLNLVVSHDSEKEIKHKDQSKNQIIVDYLIEFLCDILEWFFFVFDIILIIADR